MPARPVLYFDLGSPYAYLAVRRASAVLPHAPGLEPVLLGAIFARRGWGSWSRTPERAGRIADLQARARRYGVPAFVWPPGWPADGLAAMRAATWAKEHGAVEPFALRVFERQFAGGEDIADLRVLERCAEEAGLDAAALRDAIASPAIKQRLREATDAAWDAGVRGIPTTLAGGELFYGDDRLEDAASAVAS